MAPIPPIVRCARQSSPPACTHAVSRPWPICTTMTRMASRNVCPAMPVSDRQSPPGQFRGGHAQQTALPAPPGPLPLAAARWPLTLKHDAREVAGDGLAAHGQEVVAVEDAAAALRDARARRCGGSGA